MQTVTSNYTRPGIWEGWIEAAMWVQLCLLLCLCHALLPTLPLWIALYRVLWPIAFHFSRTLQLWIFLTLAPLPHPIFFLISSLIFITSIDSGRDFIMLSPSLHFCYTVALISCLISNQRLNQQHSLSSLCCITEVKLFQTWTGNKWNRNHKSCLLNLSKMYESNKSDLCNTDWLMASWWAVRKQMDPFTK